MLYILKCINTLSGTYYKEFLNEFYVSNYKHAILTVLAFNFDHFISACDIDFTEIFKKLIFPSNFYTTLEDINYV